VRIVTMRSRVIRWVDGVFDCSGFADASG
jgi:hypothetical protein